jgi:hypothetical protein
VQGYRGPHKQPCEPHVGGGKRGEGRELHKAEWSLCCQVDLHFNGACFFWWRGLRFFVFSLAGLIVFGKSSRLLQKEI